MKLAIEARSFTPPAGKEWDPAAYPGPGLYHSPVTQDWLLVYQMPSTTSLTYAMLGKGFRCPIPHEEYVEAKAPEPSGITAADILKAIAISQNPLLAKDLLK